MSFETLCKDRARLGFAQAFCVEEKPVGISGNIPLAGQLRDRKSAKRKQPQRSFGAGHEHSAAIADPNDPGDPMVALEFRGTD